MILAGFAAQPQYQGKLKVVGKPFSDRELRRRHQEGRHRAVHQGEHRDREDGLRRLLAEGAGRHRRASGFKSDTQHQPAEAGRLLLSVPRADDVRVSVRGRQPRTRPPPEEGSRWTILTTPRRVRRVAAFWMTIKLTVAAAIGALIIGT